MYTNLKPIPGTYTARFTIMAENLKEPLQNELRELPINDSTMKEFISAWEKLDDYPLHEKVLQELFTKHPNNTNEEEVLLKCTVLNAFYSTFVRTSDLIPLAKAIVKLEIDDRLRDGDLTVVSEIATCLKDKKYLSFASKYCSWHNQQAFPIYDKYVVELLCTFKGDPLMSFKTCKEIREEPDISKRYLSFCNALNGIVKKFELRLARIAEDKIDYKQLDRFLWLLGKMIFGKEVSAGDIFDAVLETVVEEAVKDIIRKIRKLKEANKKVKEHKTK